MENINQTHRESAAKKIKGECLKTAMVKEKIIKGEADDHPAVQAEAFYAKTKT